MIQTILDSQVSFFCYGDEENGHRACTNGHLTTANQSEIRKAYLVSVNIQIHLAKNNEETQSIFKFALNSHFFQMRCTFFLA